MNEINQRGVIWGVKGAKEPTGKLSASGSGGKCEQEKQRFEYKKYISKNRASPRRHVVTLQHFFHTTLTEKRYPIL